MNINNETNLTIMRFNMTTANTQASYKLKKVCVLTFLPNDS